MSFAGNLLLRATGPRAVKRFDNLSRAPARSQQRLLAEILGTNADTEFGRRHGFAGIATFRDYQEQVPISSYDALEPYINAEMQGQPNQLTRHPPVLFTTTSGTTGASKYIPMTSEGKHAKSRLMWLWLSALYPRPPGDRRRQDAQRRQPRDRVVRSGRHPMWLGVRARLPDHARTGQVDVHRPLRGVRHRGLRGQVLHPVAAGRRPGHQLHRHRQPEHDHPAGRPARPPRRSDHPRRAGRVAVGRRRRPRATGVVAPEAGSRARTTAGAGGQQRRRCAAAGPGLAECWRRSGAGRAGRSAPIWRVRHLVPAAAAGQGLRLLRHRAARLGPLSDQGDAGAVAVGTNVLEFHPAGDDRAPEGRELLPVERLEEGSATSCTSPTPRGSTATT